VDDRAGSRRFCAEISAEHSHPYLHSKLTNLDIEIDQVGYTWRLESIKQIRTRLGRSTPLKHRMVEYHADTGEVQDARNVEAIKQVRPSITARLG